MLLLVISSGWKSNLNSCFNMCHLKCNLILNAQRVEATRRWLRCFLKYKYVEKTVHYFAILKKNRLKPAGLVWFLHLREESHILISLYSQNWVKVNFSASIYGRSVFIYAWWITKRSTSKCYNSLDLKIVQIFLVLPVEVKHLCSK